MPDRFALKKMTEHRPRIRNGRVIRGLAARSRRRWAMAEEEGFEPPEPFGSTVFKTAAIDHSATPPSQREGLICLGAPAQVPDGT